jgi:hypothetical protein
MVLQLGDWAWSSQLLTVKNKLIAKIHRKPQTSTDTLEDEMDRAFSMNGRVEEYI